MRKGCDGEEKKRIVKIAVHYRCASHSPEWRPTRTPLKTGQLSFIDHN